MSLVRRSWNEPAQVVELTSKPLSLTIARAGAAWQQRQLSRALEALEKRPGNANGVDHRLLGDGGVDIDAGDGYLGQVRGKGFAVDLALAAAVQRVQFTRCPQYKVTFALEAARRAVM